MARVISHVFLLATITPLALAASILPSSATDGFPSCALSCTTLQNAATSCEASPSGQQSIIDSCFCQSSLLTSLKTDASTVCGSVCSSSSDLDSLQTWYNNFCSSTGTAATTTAAATTLSTSSTSTSAAAAAASTTSSSSSDTSLDDSSKPRGSWYVLHFFHQYKGLIYDNRISTHWRWILMVAVLIVGFTALGLIAVWLKRRHRRKVAAARGPTPLPFTTPSSQLSLGTSGAGTTRTGTMQSSRTRSGTMQSHRGDMREVWGPHQIMAATQGWEYNTNTRNTHPPIMVDTIEPAGPMRPSASQTHSNSMRGSGKERDMASIQEVDPNNGSRDENSKRKSNNGVKIQKKDAVTAVQAAKASLKRHNSRNENQ